MDKKDALVINDDLEKVIVDFMKYSIQLLIEDGDVYSFFEQEKMNISGVTGCSGLHKLITEYNEKLRDDALSEEEADAYKRNIHEELDSKLRDISFLTNVAERLLDKFKDNVEAKRKPLTDRNGSLKHALKKVNELDESKSVTTENYEEYHKKQNAVSPILTSFDICPIFDENSTFEDVWAKEYLVSRLEALIQESDHDIKEFNSQYKTAEFVKNSVDELKKAIKTDITEYRNSDKHNQNDDKQYHMDVRSRVKAFMQHIRKWRNVYDFKKQVVKIDDFIKRADLLYRKFDVNADTVITLGGHECRNINELIQTMAENWNLGIELLKANQSVQDLIKKESEVLLPTYELLQGIIGAVKEQEQSSRIDEIVGAKRRREDAVQFDTSAYNDYKVWYDACMFKFIYGIKPEYRPICWRGIVLEPVEFVHLFIKPLLSQINTEGARRLLLSNGLDIFAEYGLISYYFQKKNESSLGISYDIEAIRNIEISILKFCKNDEKGNPLIPLYEFFECLYGLAEMFGVSYTYQIRGTNVTVKTVEELTQIYSEFFEKKDIAGAYRFADNNTYPTLRGWLCNKYKDRKRAVNEFYDWYLTAWFYRVKRVPQLTYKGEKYYDTIEKLHKQQIPVSMLEDQCIVSYRFLKMLNTDFSKVSEYENVIRDYFNERIGYSDQSVLRSMESDEMKAVISCNPFREISSVDLVDKTDYSEEEYAFIWDLIQERLLLLLDPSTKLSKTNLDSLAKFQKLLQKIAKIEPDKDKFVLDRYYVRIHEEYRERESRISELVMKYFTNQEEERTAKIQGIQLATERGLKDRMSELWRERKRFYSIRTLYEDTIVSVNTLKEELQPFTQLSWENETASSCIKETENGIQKLKTELDEGIATIRKTVKKLEGYFAAKCAIYGGAVIFVIVLIKMLFF